MLMEADIGPQALVERSLYPSPPAHLVDDFKRHVRETGQPETFPTISTTRPPKDGAVVALWFPVDVERGKRPHRDMAPCPICSAETGKFLNNGTLIWCEASQAIYAVGPRCSHTLWADGRLDRAINVLLQTEREKANKEAVAAGVARAPAQRSWADAVRPLAKQAEELHREFSRSAPKLRGALSRGLKSASASTPVIDGKRFLKGTWKLTAKLDEAVAGLRDIEARAGRDPETWADDLAPRAVSAEMAKLKAARDALDWVHDCCAQAATFLRPENFQRLALWSAMDSAPMKFAARSSLATAELKTDEEHWRVRLGLAEPPPVP